MDRPEMILYGIAGVFLLYEIIAGWRAGPIRQAFTLVALAAGYFAGTTFGGAVTPFLRVTGYPDFILRPVAIGIVGIVVYLLVGFIGRILFRRTAEQQLGFVWFFYGVTGALIGALYGLLLILGAAILVRSLGSFATGLSQTPPAPTPALGQTLDPPPPSRSQRISVALGHLKETVDKSLVGDLIATVDPVSPETYALMEKTGRVAGDPAALMRLLHFPGMQELIQRPELQGLKDDPQIAIAAREGKINTLLKNPSLVKAANNPNVSALAKKFELQKALDYALEK